jgi:ABC-2 type transport system permease protein
MNTQSNAVPESFDSQRIAPAALSPTRPLYWSVQRELWENRSIYIAPLAVAGLALFGFLIATIGRAVATIDPVRKAAVLAEPKTFATGLVMATAFIVGVFYSLDALHGERRDRSILFWKSLPVSDLTTVLSKAAIPLVILPLLTFAITVFLQWIMLLLSSVVLMGSGLSTAPLWSQVSFFQMSMMLLYHLVTVHSLWHAPIYAWFLLVSGWARRAAFLWAVLPALAICAVEKIAFNTSYFGTFLLHRLGGPEHFPITPEGGVPMNPMMYHHLGQIFITPGLWMGLAVAAAFLFAAARLRRSQGPI